MINLWRLKYLELLTSCHGEEFVIWSKSKCCDRASEVKMRQYNLLSEIDNECEAVNVDSDEDSLIIA